MSQKCPFCGNKKKETRPTCDDKSCIEEDVKQFSLGYTNDYEIVWPSMCVDSIGRKFGPSYPHMKKRHFAEDDRANSIST